MSQRIEETIEALLSQVREGESISPNDVAKAVDAENWRRELPRVRAVIVGCARASPAIRKRCAAFTVFGGLTLRRDTLRRKK